MIVVSLLLAGAFTAFSSWFSFFGLLPASDQKPQINLTVRDSLNGRRVRAEIFAVNGSDRQRVSTDDLGKGSVLALGRTDLDIKADGYEPLQSYFVLNGNELDVTVWLDPADHKVRLAEDAARPEAFDETRSVFEGFIYDRTGRPLQNAEVSISESGEKVFTDADGAFRLNIPTLFYDKEKELPSEVTLNVSDSGRRIYTRSNILLVGGKTRLLIDLSDNETAVTDGLHRFQREREEVSEIFEQPEIAEPFFAERPAAVPVPTSIRVGTSCNTATTCTAVNVYSIDTYVRNGLDDEWIASWNANSVKAGAIAYRSYGSYHVYHPRVPASYDICNTTSCQVNDPSDTHVNSNNATTQTTGSIVTNAAGTDVLFSEYSAENNLAPGCPDGSTGRPEHNWPCLADPVDVGTTYFGHGRGMCQWGSQRWSINQGKDFVWVVNHYYNANGNPSGLRNGVLQVGPDTLLPPPDLTEPGNQTAPGTVVSSSTPTFVWQPIAGADGYSLYVSKFNGSTYDLVFNSETIVGAPITGTSYTLPSGILVPGGEYRWNMSSHIPVGYGTANTFRNYFTVSSNVTISGKVTTPSGITIRNVVVTMTDAQGVRRTATTSSFGIYTFAGVAVGQSVTLTPSTKRYRFSPQVFTVTGNLSNFDFVGEE